MPILCESPRLSPSTIHAHTPLSPAGSGLVCPPSEAQPCVEQENYLPGASREGLPLPVTRPTRALPKPCAVSFRSRACPTVCYLSQVPEKPLLSFVFSLDTAYLSSRGSSSLAWRTSAEVTRALLITLTPRAENPLREGVSREALPLPASP